MTQSEMGTQGGEHTTAEMQHNMPPANVEPAQQDNDMSHCDVISHVARTGKVKEMASDFLSSFLQSESLH
jgi:hypothetical protein